MNERMGERMCELMRVCLYKLIFKVLFGVSFIPSGIGRLSQISVQSLPCQLCLIQPFFVKSWRRCICTIPFYLVSYEYEILIKYSPIRSHTSVGVLRGLTNHVTPCYLFLSYSVCTVPQCVVTTMLLKFNVDACGSFSSPFLYCPSSCHF